MNALPIWADGWQGLARAAGELAVSQLWQGAAVAAGLVACLAFAPRTHASHRFALWLGAFVALAALPLLPWALAAFASVPVVTGESVHSAASSGALLRGALLRLDPRWSGWIAAAWLVAAAIRLGLLAVGVGRARTIWKEAVPLAGLEGLAERLPMRGRVEICHTEQFERPSVIGFFRPRILIPAWLVGQLSEDELRQIVLHEMEHLRRFDDWTNLAQKLCVALLPLNPALVWMERRLDREREMACDEAVVRRTRAPRAYAACLATVAERRLEAKLASPVEALALGAWRRRPQLAERVYSLLRAQETLHPAGRAALAGALSCALLAATVALARCPQLVEFAPARQQETTAKAAPAPVAVVASEHSVAVARRKAAKTKAVAAPEAEVAQAAMADGAVEAVPVVARMESGASPTRQNGVWLVLSVFEERVTVGGQTAIRQTVVADYQMAPEAENNQPQKRAPGTLPSFKTLPAAPVAMPIRDGWMVFEL